MGEATVFHREQVPESKLMKKLRSEGWSLIPDSTPPTYQNGQSIYMIPAKVSLGLWLLSYYKGKCPCTKGR